VAGQFWSTRLRRDLNALLPKAGEADYGFNGGLGNITEVEIEVRSPMRRQSTSMPMEKSDSAKSDRSEMLLDEGKRRWQAFLKESSHI